MMIFQPATRKKTFLRLAIDGPSGGGKSFTVLRIASALSRLIEKETGTPGRIAAIDTEAGSLSKYAGDSPDGIPFAFDVLELSHHAPSSYSSAIGSAAQYGYDILIIDSLSHAWTGVDGALEQVTKAQAKSRGGNSFTAWKDVTPQHQALVESILRAPMHVLATLRTKTEYVLEPDDKGRMVPRKVGLAPVQRAGIEYEFDIVCDISQEHALTVSKTRCPAIDGIAPIIKPGATFAEPIWQWLRGGVEVDASYYAPRPEEIAAAEKAAEAKLSPEERKRRKIERAAAKRAEVQAEQVGGTTETPSPQVTPGPLAGETPPKDPGIIRPANGETVLDCTTYADEDRAPEWQRDRIKLLIDRLGDDGRSGREPHEYLSLCLRKRGIGALAGITHGQASELITSLQDRLDKLDAATAFDVKNGELAT